MSIKDDEMDMEAEPYEDVSLAKRLLAHPAAPSFLAIFSDACFITMDGSIQAVERTGMSIGEIVFIRMVVTVLGCGCFIYLKDPTLLDFPGLMSLDKKWLWIRGSLNSIGLALAYTSFEFITLSESITVFNLRPFPVALLCFVFLGEHFSKVQLLACVASMGAVILVVQPEFLSSSVNEMAIESVPFPNHRVLGFVCIFVALFLGAIDFFLLRKIRESDALVIQLTYAITGVIIGPLWMLGLGQRPSIPDGIQCIRLVCVAVAGFIAQLTLVLALQRESGGTIAILGYAQVVMAVMLQWVMTSVLPSLEAFAGMTVIIAAGIWAALKGRPEESVLDSEEVVKMENMAYTRVRSSEEDV